MRKSPFSGRWKTARRAVQIAIIFMLLSPALGLSFFSGTLISGELFGISLTDPLAAIDHTLATRSVSTGVLTGALLLLVFYFLVGGRVFCSWVCPVHLISEIAGQFKDRSIFRMKRHPSRKYWVLGLVMVLSLVAAKPVFEIISPIGAISQNLALGLRGERAIPGSENFDLEGLDGSVSGLAVAADSGGALFFFNLSLLLLLFIALMEVFGSSGWWCGSTCPVGALYSILGRLSPLRIKINHETCNQCNDCSGVCMVPHVLLTPVEGSTAWVLSGDCSNCMNCVDTCTQFALKPRFNFVGRK